jgi:hypothetical protein
MVIKSVLYVKVTACWASQGYTFAFTEPTVRMTVMFQILCIVPCSQRSRNEPMGLAYVWKNHTFGINAVSEDVRGPILIHVSLKCRNTIITITSRFKVEVPYLPTSCYIDFQGFKRSLVRAACVCPSLPASNLKPEKKLARLYETRHAQHDTGGQHILKTVTLIGVRGTIITGSGSVDWIYWHFGYNLS